MTLLATLCPHCHTDLADGQKGKHCKSKNCTWLNHACGATVDPKRGNHNCGNTTPCEQETR